MKSGCPTKCHLPICASQQTMLLDPVKCADTVCMKVEKTKVNCHV